MEELYFRFMCQEARRWVSRGCKFYLINLVSNLTGDGKMYQLQYEKFVPILVKALQEADDKIDALTTRVAALES